MWIIFAFGSAFFAGITAILAKCGIRKTDSDIATALRTVVVLIFSWILVFFAGSLSSITSLSIKTWVFLVLSGIATGASWLCYFRALQSGDVNKVVSIDKSSTALTLIFAFIFLGEQITVIKGIAIVLITAGTYLMIEKKDVAKQQKGNKSWILYALFSALFAALTSILGKIGIEGVPSELGTAIRTFVVLIMAWLIVIIEGKGSALRLTPKNEIGYICLSGLATGGSWLCYYKALHDGPASVVVPIDKLSILISVLFSVIVLKEHISKKSAIGLFAIVAGTFLMIVG